LPSGPSGPSGENSVRELLQINYFAELFQGNYFAKITSTKLFQRNNGARIELELVEERAVLAHFAEFGVHIEISKKGRVVERLHVRDVDRSSVSNGGWSSVRGSIWVDIKSSADLDRLLGLVERSDFDRAVLEVNEKSRAIGARGHASEIGDLCGLKLGFEANLRKAGRRMGRRRGDPKRKDRGQAKLNNEFEILFPHSLRLECDGDAV